MELRAWRIKAGVVLVGRHIGGQRCSGILDYEQCYIYRRLQFLGLTVGSGRNERREAGGDVL